LGKHRFRLGAWLERLDGKLPKPEEASAERSELALGTLTERQWYGAYTRPVDQRLCRKT